MDQSFRDYRNYLFSYEFQGKRWSLELPATSEAEAKHRLALLSGAAYDGEVKAKIGGAAGPISRWFAKFGL